MKKKDPFALLRKYDGPSFFIELVPESLQLLNEAFNLTNSDSALLLKMSESWLQKLMDPNEPKAMSHAVVQKIQRKYGIKALTSHSPGPILCEFSARSLKLVRLGRGFSQVYLSEVTGLARTYLVNLESTLRDNPSSETLAKLGQALNIRFFSF